MAAQKEKADAVQRDAELQWLKVWDVTLLFVFVSRSADEKRGFNLPRWARDKRKGKTQQKDGVLTRAGAA
jgi:hypothetical protein